MNHDLVMIGAKEVGEALAGRERDLIGVAQGAYCRHRAGQSRLPHTEFLRFPELERERIIAKPGYLGGDRATAGIKWIASFPDNVANGIPRASALIILNSVETGLPTAVLEGSQISAQRTAAAAALGARLLHEEDRIGCLAVVGCGIINQETIRYIVRDERPVDEILLFDLDNNRAKAFADKVRAEGFDGVISVADDLETVLSTGDVITFATTAVVPYIDDLSMCKPTATILHTSLRDLKPEAVLQGDNITDDISHVLQAKTSLHLTEEQVGNREFIRGTIADVAEGMPARVAGKPSIFSPFGLAVLDLAFSDFVCQQAKTTGAGLNVEGFLP